VTARRPEQTTPIDPDLLALLRHEYDGAVARAGRDLEADALPVGGSRRSVWPRAAVAGAALALIAVLAGPTLQLASHVGSPQGPASSVPSVAATATQPAMATESLGPSQVPSTIDGQPVVLALDAVAEFRTSIDSSPVYVAGWLLAPDVLSCPAAGTVLTWNPCFAVHLFPNGTSGPWSLSIFRSASSTMLPDVGRGVALPMVLKVHTHDPSCPVSESCTLLPVLDGVAWDGTAQPLSAAVSSAPPSGLSESQAITAAIRSAPNRVGSTLTPGSAEAGPYALVGPGGSDVAGDRWVWAVVLSGQFYAPECGSATSTACPTTLTTELVVIDYVTGDFLIAESP
jgi:hypothetical protein